MPSLLPLGSLGQDLDTELLVEPYELRRGEALRSPGGWWLPGPRFVAVHERAFLTPGREHEQQLRGVHAVVLETVECLAEDEVARAGFEGARAVEDFELAERT